MTVPPPSTLHINLAALDRVQPQLARRLRWSVASDHVLRQADGSVVLKTGAVPQPLQFAPRALVHRLHEAHPPKAVFAFGVGLGESVETALRFWPDATVTAWDRDPWMLRLLLSRGDFSRALLTRRLRLLLGADLLEVDPTTAGKLVEHPTLVEVYRHEKKAWLATPPRNIALICTQGLFVNDVCRVLRERGFTPWTLEAERVDTLEFEHTLQQVHPTFAVAINQVVGLPEAVDAAGIPLLTWEIDPAVDWLPVPRHPVPRSHLFSFRRAVADTLADSGHGSVHWLPLAAPAHRRPVDPTDEDRARFEAPVSFVGTSMTGRARPYARKVHRELRAWLHQHDRPPQQAAGLVQTVLASQRANLDRWLVPELLDTHCPGFRTWCEQTGRPSDPALLLGELPAAEHRLKAVAALAPFGVHVWGDPGWNALESAGVTVRGFAGHFRALTRIYALSRINIDIGRLYQPDIVTMRVYDVLACGGFLLAAHSDELEDLFEVGVEVESWSTRAELVDKVRYYLANPDKADTIARRGHAAVLERHRVDQRVDRMLAVSGLVPQDG